MKKRRWGNFILLMFVLLWGTTVTAEGEQTKVEVHADMPLAGIFKTNSDQMVRLNVHLKNNGERATYDFALGRMNIQASDPISYLREIQLGAGEEKVIPLDVQGGQLEGNNLAIKLLQNGKEIASYPVFIGTPHNEWITGVLSTNADAYHFLSLVQEQGQRGMSVKGLNPGDIPLESWMLNHLDILAIGELPEGLSNEQVSAIKEWVQRGGVLIVSGGPAYAKTKALFKDFLPIGSSAVSQRSLAQSLKDYTSISAPGVKVPMLDQIKGLYWSGEVGAGHVIITSYDVSAEPLNSWQGNKELWIKILSDDLLHSLNEKDMKAAMLPRLTEISNQIPGVTPPNLPFIAGLWVLYILLVGPILYVMLRRKDKREWSWAIVPAVSILFASGVYLFGKYQVAKQDSSHTVSFIRIMDKTLAKVDSAASFLMIDGGSYLVEKPKDALFIPGISGAIRTAPVRMKETGQVEFSDVPYLSIQQLYTKTTRKDIGSFDVSLYVEDNRLKGTIANQTSFDVNHVTVHFGLQNIVLGDLEKGQSIQVNQEIKKTYMPEPRSEIGPQRPYSRAELMDSLVNSVGDGRPGNFQPIRITGISEQGSPLFKVAGHQEEPYYSTVLEQRFKLSPTPQGSVIFPYGTLPVRNGELKGEANQLPDGWELKKGSINFALEVPSHTMDVGKVEIPLNESPYQPFEKQLYNVKTERWEMVEGKEPLVMGPVQLDNYVTTGGEIVIRFTNPTEQRLILPIPYFQVEGVKK